jgi:hypothetical protein
MSLPLKDALRRAVSSRKANEIWAAAGFEDTLLRWNLKLEVGHGNETAIQSGVQG